MRSWRNENRISRSSLKDLDFLAMKEHEETRRREERE
jgi:hypothetical protein